MLMKPDRVWKGPVVELGTPIYLPISLEGRWTRRQIERLTETLTPALSDANCELITVDVTTHRDVVRWFLLRVRDRATGQIRPTHIEYER